MAKMAIRRAPRLVTATDAKNKFASVLESALRDGPVVITKHDAGKAVLLSMEEYNAITGAPKLDELTAQFDAMLDAMQKPGSRAATTALFEATPDQLGKAAVTAAGRRRG